MIFGECPYCDGAVVTPCAESTPCISKETCPNCHRRYFLIHSRVDPKVYTEEAFNEGFRLDEFKRTVEEK